ncbi:MAG: thioredoxin-disulfide reductase [Candidatus Cloacimonadales bacterium]|nr:thioredoxin-disulfide reductase [Candidatus Cloacimonadota bacterium]MDY0380950.1 thioredoxin-disulfide reductase [Candidatus Cloacimonadaceae bacterium]MCB5257396.1 thioredoxin-disulfide reductase [Candidatus Cloacimonadota bacterium]MCB5263591.1 thioredoxin-disulfide reductase [Candidatus Cloacimonadota bacterium]MCB5276345.1 thioredoxin-disulfide reductase [Candidatus Cloacimonadota bacterium]
MYDLIIIGGGPAGLSAGLYAARYKLKTLMIEKAPVAGGQLTATEWVENYPGFPEPVLGKKLAEDMETQAKFFGLEIVHEDVQSVDLVSSVKEIRTGFNTWKARTVLIATGSSPRRLGVKGEQEFSGRGVSYCATCDGPFYPDKTVAVVGAGNTAFEESLFIAKYAAKIYIVHRREGFSADPILIERVKANAKIELLTNKVVEEIDFGSESRKLKLKDTSSGAQSELAVDGLFVFIGSNPNTGLFEDQLNLDEGYIQTDRNHATSAQGVWAAGDVEAKTLRQVATAVGDGALAAYNIHKYIEATQRDA